MAPRGRKRGGAVARTPLSSSRQVVEQVQLPPELIDIFNSSQHVSSVDQALNQLKRLYKTSDQGQFEEPLRNLLKKLLQSEHTIYFKTSCD